MHVWLKLNKSFPFQMPPKIEEGLCQVIAYLYLESIRMFDTDDVAQQSHNDTKESTLRSYFSKQIEDDASPVYGDGFREAYRAVKLLGLDIVLEYVQHHHQLPDIQS
uniref:Protein DA1-like domain-containing protein n=1 Tax=Spumella elongata TaxID=89044 RepID=A0A7S3LZA6_9STRA|mmetsp:Transcript_12860/g.22548  ORF Transcript_12860/g.22548 Transcript_12860/m.22548 type:complete len:107 (+) Transcript_12860:298-618(+)